MGTIAFCGTLVPQILTVEHTFKYGSFLVSAAVLIEVLFDESLE